MRWIQWKTTKVTGLQLLPCVGIIYLTPVFGRAIDLYSLNPFKCFENVGHLSCLCKFYALFWSHYIKSTKASVWILLFIILPYALYLGVPQVFCTYYRIWLQVNWKSICFSKKDKIQNSNRCSQSLLRLQMLLTCFLN